MRFISIALTFVCASAALRGNMTTQLHAKYEEHGAASGVPQTRSVLSESIDEAGIIQYTGANDTSVTVRSECWASDVRAAEWDPMTKAFVKVGNKVYMGDFMLVVDQSAGAYSAGDNTAKQGYETLSVEDGRLISFRDYGSSSWYPGHPGLKCYYKLDVIAGSVLGVQGSETVTEAGVLQLANQRYGKTCVGDNKHKGGALYAVVVGSDGNASFWEDRAVYDAQTRTLNEVKDLPLPYPHDTLSVADNDTIVGSFTADYEGQCFYRATVKIGTVLGVTSGAGD